MPTELQNQEIAFYYPGHLWDQPEWIKSLLLFFDGVGLLVPEYKLNEPEIMDPVLAGPLRDKKLLHYYVADKVVDQEATELLTSCIDELIARGAFDSLGGQAIKFDMISRSRMGFKGDSELARRLFQKLASRNLALPSRDGVSIPIHPLIRYLILTLLAQIVRTKGSSAGIDLIPATDRTDITKLLSDFLNLPQMPSAGQVVALDLQAVSVDLSKVPLDEVLSFREENGREYRKYARSVRQFARDLTTYASQDRLSALRDRRTELADLADELSRKARTAWRRPATFSIGLVGGFWGLATNPISGLFSLAGQFAKGYEKPSNEAGAFSYLFSAQRRFT